MTARLPNENAAKSPPTALKQMIAILGTDAFSDTFARNLGSQPSHARTYGRREAYNSWALNNPHVETRPAAASNLPSQRPPISCAITGQPASELQMAGSVVMLIPATTGNR